MKTFTGVIALMLALMFGASSVVVAKEPIGGPGAPGAERMLPMPPGEIVSPEQFGTRLQDIDRQLTSIEAVFTQIEVAKTDQDKDKYADDLERRLDAYAKAMLGSITTALKQAELSAMSRGKEGSTELLKSFEDLAKKHEDRLKQIDGRAQKMRPKSGSISELVGGGKVALDWPMLKKIGDFFISPAEAAIALSVYTACHQSPPNQTACAQAVTSGIAQTAAAQTTFNACWNRYEGTRPKWWRAVLRAGCVTALGVRLA